MPTKLTLAEKLAEAAGAIGDIEKLGDNGEYTYLRAYEVFKEFRREIFKRGICIVPVKILDVVRSQPYVTVNDNIIDEVRVTVEYKISDADEEIIGQGIGVGQDYGGKALYHALTGSLKFFVQAIALIAGVPDDPETVNEGKIPDDLARKLDEAEAKFGPDLREHPISQRDVRAWGVACAQAGLRNKVKEDWLGENFGIKHISELKRKDFKLAMAWAVTRRSSEIPKDAILTDEQMPF